MRFLLYLFIAALIAATALPALDITAAGLFYNPAKGGFWLRENVYADVLHEAIQWGARVLAVVLLLYAAVNRHTRATLFLLAALLIGPGLVTNTVLKDNWGRARPVQVSEFAGDKQYTPAWEMTNQCEKNCSFVSGDAALGFFLHAFFYVVPPARRRRIFLLGFLGGGAVAGTLRVGMGAHFLSDVLWAGALMVIVTAFVHMLFYGPRATRDAWRDVFK